MFSPSPRIQFVSAIVKPNEPVLLTALSPFRLVISNACIPDISPTSPIQPSRLFGTVSPSSSNRTLLATLIPGRFELQTFGFVVAPGNHILLETVGPHTVHVIGHLHSLEESSSSNEEDEEEEIEIHINKLIFE
jgi:hypothetical protein